MKRIIMAALVGAALGAGMAYQGPLFPAKAQEGATFEALTLFGDILERVRAGYVEPVDEPELIETAINGMLNSLDPHSSYLSPRNAADMQQETEGKFGGLGIEVTLENGYVKVVAPIDDTPAARAGMQAGDLITHLDGEPVRGLTLSEAVDRMRGEIGAPIMLTVRREGRADAFEVEIIRDEIVINPVRARLEGDVGYVRITTFNKQTSEGLATRIDALFEEAGESGLSGFVIDLRNNPGGLLSQAIQVSDTFLEKGEIVSTRGRNPRDAERFNATDGDLSRGLPLVVLVNGGSASASEIVAGALQDHRRAVVVGTKTFGKGSVQTIMPLGNGGALRLTTSRYYTPSGRSIQAVGVEPDIIVEQLVVEAPAESGPSRSEAELPGALQNDTNNGQGGDADGDQADPQALLRDSDYQLSYALDLLRGYARLEAIAAQ